MRKGKLKYQKLINLIILTLILLLIFMICIIGSYITIYLNRGNEKVGNDNQNSLSNIDVVVDKEQIIEDKKRNELDLLKQMGERDRIEYYVTKFVRFLEDSEYDSAYALLNSEFKANFFPSLKSFSDYSRKHFSKMISLDYTNFERNGQIYVVWANINDAIIGRKDELNEMNFVVKENDFNDFELSFSVI